MQFSHIFFGKRIFLSLFYKIICLWFFYVKAFKLYTDLKMSESNQIIQYEKYKNQFEKITWFRFKRSSHVRNVFLHEPSTSSFRHCKFSKSILAFKLDSRPSSLGSWSQFVWLQLCSNGIFSTFSWLNTICQKKKVFISE